MKDNSRTVQCHQCTQNQCAYRYPDGIPNYCQANKFNDLIERSKQGYFTSPIQEIHLAAAKVLKRSGYDWTRVQQCIEFARELNVKKVGLAVCAGLVREGREFARYLERAGFSVSSASCLIGGIKASEAGIPAELEGSIICNPLAQADILNTEKTELNFIYGLCVGHDTLFIKRSEAPVTYVVAKDTVTGNNPGVALTSTFHRMKLAELYPKK